MKCLYNTATDGKHLSIDKWDFIKTWNCFNNEQLFVKVPPNSGPQLIEYPNCIHNIGYNCLVKIVARRYFESIIPTRATFFFFFQFSSLSLNLAFLVAHSKHTKQDVYYNKRVALRRVWAKSKNLHRIYFHTFSFSTRSRSTVYSQTSILVIVHSTHTRWS